MSNTVIRIDAAPIRMNVSAAPIRLGLSAAQGPGGLPGIPGPNSVTSATTSNGTANLSISNLTTATATVSGTLTANHIHGNLAGSVYAHIRAGEALTKGDPVYVSGFHPGSSTAEVMKADASNAAKMPAIGIMDANVAHNNTGHMVIVGNVIDIDTSTFSVNAELYVKAGGGLTGTPPTARAQPVARVERVNLNNGAIIVKVNGLSASDATANTLVRRDASGNFSAGTITASLTGTASDVNPAGTSIAAALSGKQPLDADLTAISALTTTANGRALLTSANALTIGASASVSGTNTGDQDLSGYLPVLSSMEVAGLGSSGAFGDTILEDSTLTFGKRSWGGAFSELVYTGTNWNFAYNDGANSYQATIVSTSDEPWKLGSWTIIIGTGDPSFLVFPSALQPVNASGTIAVVADQQGRVSPYEMTGLGGGVSAALAIASDTDGGFLTAGVGGPLPIERGGTGSTIASDARIALGAGTTGDALFKASNIAQLDAAMDITTVKKTSDQALISTSLVSAISFPVVANVKYRIWGELILQSTITSVGFTSELWFPVPDTVLGSGVMGWMMQTNGALTGIQLLTTTRSNWLGAYSGAAAVRRLPFDLTTRFTTSGTVQIAVGQRTPDVANPSYCKAGTYMKYQIIDA